MLILFVPSHSLLEQPGTLTSRSEVEVGIKTSVNKWAAQKEK